jgi:hypothetical protein
MYDCCRIVFHSLCVCHYLNYVLQNVWEHSVGTNKYMMQAHIYMHTRIFSKQSSCLAVPTCLDILADLICFLQMWVYAISVFLVFVVTLSCYPAINSRIFSTTKDDNPSAWEQKYYIPVTCFLLFNFGDLIGRTLAGPIQRVRFLILY